MQTRQNRRIYFKEQSKFGYKGRILGSRLETSVLVPALSLPCSGTWSKSFLLSGSWSSHLFNGGCEVKPPTFWSAIRITVRIPKRWGVGVGEGRVPRGSFLKKVPNCHLSTFAPTSPGLAAGQRISINEPSSWQTSKRLSQSTSFPNPQMLPGGQAPSCADMLPCVAL